jgi:YbbR domain-containing protein
MSLVDNLGRAIGDAFWIALGFLRSAAESVRENVGLAVISLALSVALWVYVSNEANPPRTDIFPSTLPVTLRNVPAVIQVMSPPGTVQVRVSAPLDVWSRLRASSFSAMVDLTGAGPGLAERDVLVETTEPQARVIEVLPPRVAVRLEAITEQQVPVRAIIEGQVPAGFTSDPADVKPNQVTVRGPSSLVDQVKAAAANVRIENLRVSLINQSFSLYAVDAQGMRVSGVTLAPEAATVTIDIVQQLQTRTLSIMPVIKGTPAPGYWPRNVTVEPVAVTVFGERATLEGIDVLRTKVVEITGAKADLRRQIEIDLPPGVSLAAPNNVTLNVTIAPIQGTSRVVVAPILVGVGPDLEASAPAPVEVTLSGDLPLLQALDPTTVVVTFDLTGLRPGSHDVAPRVSVPEGLTLVGVNPAKSNVALRPAATPAASPSGGGG